MDTAKAKAKPKHRAIATHSTQCEEENDAENESVEWNGASCMESPRAKSSEREK